MTQRTARMGFICVMLIGVFLWVSGIGEENSALLAEIEAELIPPYGAQTGYGMPLDLRNTARFIDWFYGIELTQAEAEIKDRALEGLAAPCCDDNTAATCCCVCNLSRSLWGLSAHLVRDEGYGVDDLRAAADEWLRFTRPDYYVAVELQARGLDPADFGLTTFGSCYRNLCDVPLTEGGCAGMTDLVAPHTISPVTTSSRDRGVATMAS